MLFHKTKAPGAMHPGAGPSQTSEGTPGMMVSAVLLCSV